MMEKILIAGIGSVLRADDGLGPRVIDELKKETLAEEVTLHSGDVSGLDLLKVFPGFDKIIIVDAADFGAAPGTIRIFSLPEIKRSGFRNAVSTHGISLKETLILSEKLDLQDNITIVGVQPGDISHKLDLSDIIKSRMPAIMTVVKDLI